MSKQRFDETQTKKHPKRTKEQNKAYKNSAESVRKVWGGSHDGNFECAWCEEVEPYEEELQRRGIRL